MLFSFQGKVWLAERDASGNALKPVWVGNAPELTLNLQTNNTQKMESYTGNRLQIGELTGAKTASINLTLDEWTLITLGLALYSSTVNIATDSVTAEAIPTPTEGDFIRLAHAFISNLVLTDSADPTPQALVLDTDYRIESASAGIIELLATPADAPVTAAYDYDAVDSVTLFTSAPPVRWLMLDGINTDNNERVLVDLYKVKFNPVGNLALITDEYGNIALTGSVLYDPLHADDAELGGFGRVLQPEAA